jgi:antitoxin (DNA-binding transcriptional repressor) of toxin-antitoxin stability system
MTYTVQEAEVDFARLLKEAEEGNEVVIERDGKPVARLAAVEVPVSKMRIPGQYAGQFQYSDEIFKPLETDEELREYGFDILVDAKVIEPDQQNERVA